jgi:hypothetical protein
VSEIYGNRTVVLYRKGQLLDAEITTVICGKYSYYLLSAEKSTAILYGSIATYYPLYFMKSTAILYGK